MELAGVHNCCGSCTQSIKKAIKAVDGVEAETVKPKAESFVVEGNFDLAAVVKSLLDAGFYVQVKKYRRAAASHKGVNYECCLRLDDGAGHRVGSGSAAPTGDEIDRWVKQLGADDFAARQAATDALWQAGPAALVALTEAARSDDPEVRFRAKAVLDKVRSGVRPDTPPELAALIDQFRFGAEPAQRQALAELRTKGQWSIVLALLRAEKNADRRRMLAQAVAPDAGKLVRPLIEKGQLDDAQTILELTAVQQPGLVQLATFLLLTDRLNDAVADVQRRQATDPQPEDWLRLAWLARAKGDQSAAIAAAEKTTDKYLLLNLVSESRDWKRAAALMTELAAANPAATDHAAFLTTFHRLAGNDAAYAAAIKTFGQAPKPPDPFAPAPAPRGTIRSAFRQ